MKKTKTTTRSITSEIEALLNKQIVMEGNLPPPTSPSHRGAIRKVMIYQQNSFYKHSEEERKHMLKLFRYVNAAGGHGAATRNFRYQTFFQKSAGSL